METVAPIKEIIEIIQDSGGDGFKLCYQCGLCDTVCPWNRVRSFSMRKIVREATFGLTDIETEEIWRCTTCGNCPRQCPRGVKIIESGVALRRISTEYGVFPAGAKPVPGISASLRGKGNPLNEERQQRADWAQGLGVEPFTEEMEYLYFPGCYLCYDPRLKKVAQATVKLLQTAGIQFGILGAEENCCGESIRKTGDEELFKQLARDNIKTFIDHGVKKILVSSPHCFHTFRNEYPEFRVNFEVVHITQLLADLVQQGRLNLEGKYSRKVAYHDPCYLGRHNGVYDEPRGLLTGIDGVELVEMADARENSLCCGGGGGRVWMETHKGERFSDLRVEQAVAAGAQVLATACPYCISHFEESRLSLEEGNSLEIRDITEILQKALQGAAGEHSNKPDKGGQK